MNNFLEQCKAKAAEIGVLLDSPIADGQLHRYGTSEKPNSKDGAAIIYNDEPLSMWAKSWHTGEEITCTAKPEGTMSKAERRIFNERVVKEKAQREADRQQRHNEAAQKAQCILSQAQAADDSHPYLQRKQVPALGVKLSRDGSLMVPVFNEEGKAQSLQFINENGDKRFLAGGKIDGGFFPIAAKNGSTSETLCIAEGYATAASIHEATGYAVLITLNAGNTESVAKMARRKYPERKIIICADNDFKEGSSQNVGIEAATKAAKSTNSLLAVCPLIDDKKADFNDLYIAQGLEAVKDCIDKAVSPHEMPQVQSEAKPPLCVVDLEELLSRSVPPRNYLLDPIIPEQGLCMIFAERGVGKTFAGLNIAYAVAAGGNVFSWNAKQPNPILYVDGEMPFNAMQSRIAGIVSNTELEPQKGFFRVLTPDLQPDDSPMPNLATKEGQAALEPHLQGVKLLVLDNLATLCRNGRSNDEESWLPVQEWILTLRRRGISVLLIHHAGKNGGQRGTSAKEDILDTVIQLRRPNDYSPEQGARFEVHLTKARGIVGDAAEPFEAQLITNDGVSTWTVKSIEDSRAEQIRLLADEGLNMREIAEEMGISKSAVSRLCKKLDITTKGKK